MTATAFALHVVAAFVGCALAVMVGVIGADRLSRRRERRQLDIQAALARPNHARPGHARTAIPVVDPDGRTDPTRPTVRQSPFPRPAPTSIPGPGTPRGAT